MSKIPLITRPDAVARWRRYRLEKHGVGAGSFFTVNGLNPVVAAAADTQDILLFVKPPHGILDHGDRCIQIETQVAFGGSVVCTLDSIGLGAAPATFVCNPLYNLLAAAGPTNFALFNVSLVNRLTDDPENVTATLSVNAGDTMEDIVDGGSVDIFVNWSQVPHGALP